MASSITIYYMVMALKCGQMGGNMLASGEAIKSMEQVFLLGQIRENTKENIVMISSMEKEGSSGLAARFITEDGLMASRKVKL